MSMWHELRRLGYSPFCPHWNHYQDEYIPRPAQDWMDWDNEWLVVCDVVLRMPGFSPGSEAEVALARSRNIPVVYSLAELKREYPTGKEDE